MNSNARFIHRLANLCITSFCVALLVSCSPDKPATDEAEIAFDTMEPTASGIAQTRHEGEGDFTPTHTVKVNLNLRPSASLNTTPIVVLKAGSEVEYIKEADGWYYVNTQFYGKGWCSSEYLSSLSRPQNNTSVN